MEKDSRCSVELSRSLAVTGKNARCYARLAVSFRTTWVHHDWFEVERHVPKPLNAVAEAVRLLRNTYAFPNAQGAWDQAAPPFFGQLNLDRQGHSRDRSRPVSLPGKDGASHLPRRPPKYCRRART
jgi:hypothetical protein